MKQIVVIAYKFNDIFYAVNTKEFSEANVRVLIIFTTGKLTKDSFPFVGLFDNVYEIKYKHSQWALPSILAKMLPIIKKYNNSRLTLAFSNWELVSNQFLVSRLSNASVVLLEDGLINYYYDKTKENKDRFQKRLILSLLRISKKIAKDRTICTYLHEPASAVYFYGEARKLILERFNLGITKEIPEEFNGKSILVGGGYLESIDINERSELVQSAIKKFKIDFFIPHHFSPVGIYDSIEQFDLNSLHVTFEMLLPHLKDVKIYSFGSSILLSAESINPVISTNFILSSKHCDEKNAAINYLKKISKMVVVI